MYYTKLRIKKKKSVENEEKNDGLKSRQTMNGED